MRRHAIIRIICTRTPEEMNRIQEVYHQTYGVALVSALEDESSGTVQRAFAMVLDRTEQGMANAERGGVEAAVKELYKAGEADWFGLAGPLAATARL